MNKVDFNYFYRFFLNDYQNLCVDSYKKRIGVDQEFSFLDLNISNDEALKWSHQALWNTCLQYISLGQVPCDVIPTDAFEFVCLCLESSFSNPYRESFLHSLQFIYQGYFVLLGLGFPLLTLSSSEEDSCLELCVTKDFKLTELHGVNIALEEMTKYITQYVMHVKDKQIGPLPHTRIRVLNF